MGADIHNYEQITIKRLKVSDIVIEGRLREVDSKKVDKLKKSIARVGLINPITVSGNKLIAGLHRFTALKELGIEEIDCREIGDDELRNSEIEIDENLCRSELSVLDRGKFESIKKRNESEWAKRQYVIPYDGIERTEYEYAKIENIIPEAIDKISKTNYKNDEEFLLTLAGLPEKEQMDISSKLMVRDIQSYVNSITRKKTYPYAYRKQIKFQIDDDISDLAKRFTDKYKMTIPLLAKKVFEMYLKSFFAEEKTPDDIDFVELFEGLSTGVAYGDCQEVKSKRYI